jgi:hypothetical protein
MKGQRMLRISFVFLRILRLTDWAQLTKGSRQRRSRPIATGSFGRQEGNGAGILSSTLLLQKSNVYTIARGLNIARGKITVFVDAVFKQEFK